METKLDHLLMRPAENEVVEFKEAKNGYAFNKLGKCFSALCNEANLKSASAAWLVFGVSDRRQVVGSAFRPSRKDLDSLKEEIVNRTTNRITFVEIHEVVKREGRVALILLRHHGTYRWRLMATARQHLPHLHPLLMDRTTFDAHAHLAVPEPVVADGAPSGIWLPAEAALATHLRTLVRGRLEQEFVSPQAVANAVTQWRSGP